MATKTGTQNPLTVADITDGYDNPEWYGFGYLGTWLHALTDSDCGPAQHQLVTEADARIIALANERGWTTEQLFTWLNSKLGRRLGDAWFDGAAGEALERAIRREFKLPVD